MAPDSPPPEFPGNAITVALAAMKSGEEGAVDALFTAVYPELRQLAHRQLASVGPRRTLGTTALVHELYLKLSASCSLDARDREHFLAISARAMRQIIVDAARRAQTEKRQPVLVTAGPGPGADLAADLIALDAALGRLQTTSPRLGSTVELRFFGGLSVEETAEVLGISSRTVKRDWRTARAFLYRELNEGLMA